MPHWTPAAKPQAEAGLRLRFGQFEAFGVAHGLNLTIGGVLIGVCGVRDLLGDLGYLGI